VVRGGGPSVVAQDRVSHVPLRRSARPLAGFLIAWRKAIQAIRSGANASATRDAPRHARQCRCHRRPRENWRGATGISRPLARSSSRTRAASWVAASRTWQLHSSNVAGSVADHLQARGAGILLNRLGTRVHRWIMATAGAVRCTRRPTHYDASPVGNARTACNSSVKCGLAGDKGAPSSLPHS
jgi:hypothetical protein